MGGEGVVLFCYLAVPTGAFSLKNLGLSESAHDEYVWAGCPKKERKKRGFVCMHQTARFRSSVKHDVQLIVMLMNK